MPKNNNTIDFGNVLLQEDEIDNETALFEYETTQGFGGIEKPKNSIFEEIQNEPEVSIIEGIDISVSTQNEFSYLAYHADVLGKHYYHKDKTEYSFFKSFKIVNKSEYVLENLRIEISFSNNMFKCRDILISVLEHNRSLDLKSPNMIVDVEKLATITKKTPVVFNVSIYSNESNRLIYKTKKGFKFNVLPLNTRSTEIALDDRIYAKFVNQNPPVIKKIIEEAQAHLPKKQFLGYKNEDINELINEAKAIYDTISEYGIAFQNPSQNDIKSVKVRLANEIIDTKKGTCLDLALLYASALEECGIHSLIVLTEGHALAGFFLNKDESFQGGYVEEAGVINNMVGDQINKIVLVDIINAAVGCKESFKQAMVNGKLRISTYQESSFTAIDVNTCQNGIYSPVVVGAKDEVLEGVIKESINDESIDPINSANFVDVSNQKEMDKFIYWEHKLLDLNEGNQLINTNVSLSNVVKLISEEPLYDYASQNSSFNLDICELKIKTKAFQQDFFLSPNMKPSNFDRTLKPELIYAVTQEETLKTLIKKADASMDETGASTLYLCFGLMSFKRQRNDKRANCPFMILPVKANKEKNSKSYTISYDFDEVLLNETFFEYFKTINPDSDYSMLYNIDPSHKYSDIINTFKKYCHDDIVLEPNIFFLTNLTFSNYILWLDVRKRQEELRKNKVIDSIIKSQSQVESFTPAKIRDYSNLAAPLSFDSTQVNAIEACSEGKSFILDGPPGTGKSQTIVNMIVNAFYHGKTVLFVAEKKAALDVVADRLKAINLDRFCLELHSNKASKREFFGKLGEVMDENKIDGNEQYPFVCSKITNKMDNIIKKLSKLHDRKYFMSLYEAIYQYEELMPNAISMPIKEEVLLDMTEEKLVDDNRIIDTIVNLAANLPDFDESLLRYIGSSKLSYNEKDEFTETAGSILDLLKKSLSIYLALTSTLKISFDNTLTELDTISRLFELSFKTKLYTKYIPEIMSNTNEASIRSCLSHANRLATLNDKYSNKYLLDKIINLDCDTAIKELPEAGFFLKRKYKNKLKKCLVPTYKLDNDKVLDCYNEIKKYNDLRNSIKGESQFINKITEKNILDSVADVKSIQESYNNTKEFISLLKALKPNDFLTASNFFIHIHDEKPANEKMQYFAYDEVYSKYKEKLQYFVEKESIYYDDLAKEDVKVFIDFLSILEDPAEFNHIIMMTSINFELSKLDGTGLEMITELLRAKKLKYQAIHDTVDFNLAYGYIKLYFKDEEVNYFNSALVNKEIAEYKNLINEYSSLVVEETAHRLTDKTYNTNINATQNATSPIGQLRKFIASGGRGISIREALVNYDDIIRSYFPCFLMSPLSAAQYLAFDTNKKKGASKFDIVIFDEASQIPTHEAIGAIARGNSLIVAGDPEQMPPSSYFNAGLEMADEFIRFEDAASLLDECLAIDLPRIRLSYHYRSKHESLISFSNKNFYNNDLFTFPSPSMADDHIQFKHVELKERKLKSNITNEEIEAILDTVKEIYSNPANSQKSLGIIVFNVTQAERLTDKMNMMLQKDKKLASVFDNMRTPFFIKSLENVQGDERDIIILSVGFRLNESDKAVVLGPIARDHGERRLNVAITRSKEKMIVVSTIKASNFDFDENIYNRGTLLLKHFLKYAESTAKAQNIKRSSDKNIAEFLKKDLEDLGYEADINIGESRYKIDLAIRNQETGNYDLGVIIDNSVNSKDISLRDAVYLKNSMFKNLHWNIVDVYSIDYYKDKKAVIDQIINALRKNEEAQIQDTSINLKKLTEEEFKYATIEYKAYESKAIIGYNAANGFDKNLAQAVKSIISIEAPVSFNTIKQRIKVASGMQKMSAQAQALLKNALATHPYRTVENDITFYWKDSNYNVVKFRNSYDRDIYDICNAELLCVMRQIVDIKKAIGKEELYKLTLEALGYQAGVLSKKNAERLDIVYDLLASEMNTIVKSEE